MRAQAKCLYSIAELLGGVNEWCRQNRIYPATGQMSETLTERTIHYYRTIQLLDPPVDNGLKYSSKHLGQLKAVRLLQSHSLTLPRIRALLFGKSEGELIGLIEKGLKTRENQQREFGSLPESEHWTVIPIDPEFLLLSRHGRRLTGQQMDQIKAVLAPHSEKGNYDESHPRPWN